MEMIFRDQMRTFVTQRLRMHGDFALPGDNDPLFSSGRLDSLDAVELVMVLEAEHGIDFARIEFDLQRLDSVTALTELVATRAVPT